MTVDTRKSGPKLVCFYTDRPSSYLDMKDNKNYLFRSDSFDLRNEQLNPFYEDFGKKTDYALSNRVVGFNVDIGTRNQNIFYSFSITQDSGKATSESIQQINLMANSATGRSTATQNVSLYNIYKNMSYECEVVALGNALLQPTMYFNLRHVPLFNGSYMITEVKHSIQPGQFQTTFKGIRQSYMSLPRIDVYLQSIKTNLVSKLLQQYRNTKDNPLQTASTTTQANNANQTVQTNNQLAAQNSCTSKVSFPYLEAEFGFQSVAGRTFIYTPQQFYDEIRKVEQRPEVVFGIFVISWMSSGIENKFKGYDYNFGKVTLTSDYGPLGDKYFTNTYTCQSATTEKNSNVTLPYVSFVTIDKYILFVRDKILPSIQRIKSVGVIQYYLQNWPYDKQVTETQNISLSASYAKAVDLLNNVTPPIKTIQLPPRPVPNPTTNLGNVVTATPPCPTPSVSTVFVQGQGPGTGNIPPTPTPSTSSLPPITTDDVILANALTLNQYDLSVNYVSQVDNRLTGVLNVFSGQLVNSYPVTLVINQDNLIQSVPVADFEISGNTLSNNSDGSFVSQNSWNVALDRITENGDYYVDFVATVRTPARLYRFTTTLGILPLDCPNLGYKANDIVSVSILDSILNNFCCSCYPSGSGTRIVSFNGVQCKQIGSNC